MTSTTSISSRTPSSSVRCLQASPAFAASARRRLRMLSMRSSGERVGVCGGLVVKNRGDSLVGEGDGEGLVYRFEAGRTQAVGAFVTMGFFSGEGSFGGDFGGDFCFRQCPSLTTLFFGALAARTSSVNGLCLGLAAGLTGDSCVSPSTLFPVLCALVRLAECGPEAASRSESQSVEAPTSGARTMPPPWVCHFLILSCIFAFVSFFRICAARSAGLVLFLSAAPGMV